MATYNPPQNVGAAWNSARTGIVIRWTNPSQTGTVYWITVERSVNGGPWSFDYATLDDLEKNYTDTDVSVSNYYQYKVGYERGAKGGWTESAIVAKIPSAPTGCTASRVSDILASASVTLASFNDTNKPDKEYIERQTDAGSWVQVAQSSVSSAAQWKFSDNGIAANHRYRYRARTGNGAGYSSYVYSGYIYTTPAAPTKVTPTKTSSGTVSVAATVSAPYATGYDVQRSTDGGSTWTSVATNTSLPYTDSIAATKVRYRVRSVRDSLASAWKESADITSDVPPLAPTITAKPNAVTASGTAVTIRWSPNHPDGSAQSSAQVLVTPPSGTATTYNVSGATSYYTFTPGSVGIWTAQVRTHGLAASWGAWSQTIQWRMADRPSVTITSPATDGTEIDDLPLTISWEVSDVSGVSAQSVTIAHGGDAIYTRTPSASSRLLRVTRNDAVFEDGAVYSISIRVVNGYGLDSTTVRTFVIGWDLPAAPIETVEQGEGASAIITVSIGRVSTVPTESISVQRINPDGTLWTVANGLADGGSCTDPLPPLGVDVIYRAIAYAASGASAQTETTATIGGKYWMVNAGAAAEQTMELRYNPEASASLDHGGESYHFADGGAGSGLPVWYGTTDRDESGSLKFATVGKDDADRLAELSKAWPVMWLRDPFGHRWRAHVRPSVSHGLGHVWSLQLGWDAVRWREAWDG